jgi:hypothetical protein
MTTYLDHGPCIVLRYTYFYLFGLVISDLISYTNNIYFIIYFLLSSVHNTFVFVELSHDTFTLFIHDVLFSML